MPVTISTVRVLTLVSDGQHYGIPSSAIIRTGSAKLEDLHQLEESPVLTLDDDPLRWVHLGDLLGIKSTRQISDGHKWPYLLLGCNGQRMVVAVDDLEEEIEVLLKPMGFPLSSLPGIVGAMIRPDGSVQLVLDISAMTDRIASRSRLPDREKPAVIHRVLVADDSPTTRALLRNLLSAAGYSVKTATDGVNALDNLGKQDGDDGNLASVAGFSFAMTTTAALPEDTNLPRALAESFLIEEPELIRQFHDALACDDSVLAMRAAHTLKGSAAVFAATRVEEYAEQIENLAKEQRLDECNALFPFLEKLTARMNTEPNEFLAREEA